MHLIAAIPKSHPSGSLLRGCRLGVGASLLAIWATLLLTPSVSAQPIGTIPTSDIIRGEQESSAGIRPHKYLWLDATGTVVATPVESYEEFERFLKSGAGGDTVQQTYALQSLSVTGETTPRRALLNTTLKLSVDATEPGRQWDVIPLRMTTFRLLAPPQVTGDVDYRLIVAPDNAGYLLLIHADAATELTMESSFAALVDEESKIRFDLPSVPTTISVEVDGQDIVANVEGTYDEIVSVDPTTPDKTTINVESSGGVFALRWGQMQQSRSDAPLLDVVSNFDIEWDMPSSQPLVSVSMTVKNLRGTLSSFDILLPTDSILDDTPTHNSAESQIDVNGPISAPDGERLRVTIPAELRKQDIVIRFSLRLEATGVSRSSPLLMEIPQVVNSSRHGGEFSFRTTSDYRLRWLTTPFVRNVLDQSAADETAQTYQFDFDRGTFRLPVWLAAKQRQLRLSLANEIRFVGDDAELSMVVTPQGQVDDGRLRIEANGWLIRSIIDVETREQLEVLEIGSVSEVKLNSRGGGDAAEISVIAEKPIDVNGEIELTLPQVIASSDDVIVQQSSVRLINDGRSTFVVDQSNSARLDRIAPAAGNSGPQDLSADFRVFPPDSKPIIVGRLVPQQLQINLDSSTEIDIVENGLQTVVDWNLTSSFDLEGRLFVRFVSDSREADDTATGSADQSAADDPAPSAMNPVDAWTVTVNGVVANLRPTTGNAYELISDRLSSGTLAIRWKLTTPFELTGQGEGRESSTVRLELPRPVRVDVTVQGVVRTSLTGTPTLELSSLDRTGIQQATPATESAGDVVLHSDSLPRWPLDVMILPRKQSINDLTVTRALLRTVVGEMTQFEQLIAAVRGSSALRINIPKEFSEYSVEASVNGAPIAVGARGGTLEISLPDSTSTHFVNLRFWFQRTNSGVLRSVTPTLQLPIGTERVYWQVITAQDQHSVWASANSGRAMSWQFDGWRMFRQTAESERELCNWVARDASPEFFEWLQGAPDSLTLRDILAETPAGNEYLFVGSDSRSFRTITVSRSLLWLLVGSIVLIFAVALTYVPQTQTPLTAVLFGVLYCGLIAVAPDAAVLCGQIALVATVLVVIMVAIRTQLTSRRSNRVLNSGTRGSTFEPSTQGIPAREPSPAPASSIAETQTLQVESKVVEQSGSEVSL